MTRCRVWLIVGAALAAVFSGRVARADEERWYGVLLMGERAGWLHEAEITTGKGNLRALSELRLRIGRGDGGIEVTIETMTEETPDGQMVSMRSVQTLGAQPSETRYEWTDEGVRVVSVMADGTQQMVVQPAPEGEWDAPIASRRRGEALLREGAKEMTLRTIDPTGGLQVVEVHRVWVADEVVEALGKAVHASRWDVTQSVVPGVVSVEYVNGDGELIRGETNFGGMTLTMVAADKETALLPATGPEFMRETLVDVVRPIENPRRTRSAEYVLRVGGGALPDLPSGGAQRFERIDGASGRLFVDVGGSVETEGPREKHLARSSMLDSGDPTIVALTREALRGHEGDDDGAKAERLRRFVHSFISSKNLDVGFATASETARTRQGDCTEHGVLLAAMLRSAGIPSRCVSGLVYADGFLGRDRVFGYHMWAQAHVRGADGSGRWVDVDGTLPDETSFDATHIALAWTAFEGGDRLNAFAALAPLLGRLEIEVVRAE